MSQPSTILLIRPRHFGYNIQTAANNAFQAQPDEAAQAVADKALSEFEAFGKTLRSHGVNVLVFDDTAEPVKPDAVFPNNWVTFHPDGKVILYPMFAPNRRHERRRDIIDALQKEFRISEIIDLSGHELENRFLEGTGSIVFDHYNKTAYACISPRTDAGLLAEVCGILNYEPVVFKAVDHGGMAVYHTNVMMCVGKGFSVICLDSITDGKEREMVQKRMKDDKLEVIPISLSQMSHFAGNMLAIHGKDHQLLGMSQSAYDSLSDDQRKSLSRHCELLPLNIETIETIGGGSARCMMAEVFLPRK